MPEIKAETDNLQVNEYSNGAVHFYDVNPNGVRTHISEAQMLADRGHDVNGPRTSPNPNQVPPPIDLQPVIDAINQLAANQANNPNANIMAQLSPFLQGMQTQMNTMMTLIQQLQNQNIAQAPQQPATPGTPPAAPGAPATPAAPVAGAPAAANQQQQPAGPSPEQQEVDNALRDLEKRRRELAEIVVRRKTRSVEWLTPGARRDRDNYQHARQLYDQAKARFMAAKAQLRVGEAIANGANIPTDDELGRDMMLQSYDEQTAFISEEFSVVDELRSNDGRWGRLLNRWAKVSTKKKIAIGLLVGGGATLVSGGLGLGVFGLAVGSAARFSLGVFGNRASTRNVSEHTKRNMIEDVARRRRAAENSPLNIANLPGYGNRLVQDGRRHETRAIRNAKRHQRFGALIMAASAIPFVRGLDHVAAHFNSGYTLPDIDWPNNVHWPDFFGHHGHPGVGPSHPPYHVIDGGATHTGGGPGFPGSMGIEHGHGLTPSTNSLMANFHPASFKGGTPHLAVKHAFNVFERNNIQVDGLTDAKVDAIVQAMKNQHLPIAIGLNANGSQHIMDSAQAYAGHFTPNYRASGLEGMRITNGSSVNSWKHFMNIAKQHGVTFSRTA